MLTRSWIIEFQDEADMNLSVQYIFGIKSGIRDYLRKEGMKVWGPGNEPQGFPSVRRLSEEKREDFQGD